MAFSGRLLEYGSALLVAAALVLSGGSWAGAKPASAQATAPETSFAFRSSPDDFVGGGRKRTFVSPLDSITVSGNRDEVSVSVQSSDGSQYFEADFAAGVGDTLHPGIYPGAERYPFETGRAPGLSVYGDSRGCNEDFGTFTVNQIGFDRSGTVIMADIGFVQHCESTSAPALRGTLHVNYLPLSYTQTSDPGDYVGGGVDKTYLNSSSTIAVSGTANDVGVSVSGLGDNWSVTIAAPTGTTLVPGKTYDTARFADATHAGLDVSGDGRGCNTSTGTLTIDKITVHKGSLSRISATFVQHCEGAEPALTGTLHYFD